MKKLAGIMIAFWLWPSFSQMSDLASFRAKDSCQASKKGQHMDGKYSKILAYLQQKHKPQRAQPKRKRPSPAGGRG